MGGGRWVGRKRKAGCGVLAVLMKRNGFVVGEGKGAGATRLVTGIISGSSDAKSALSFASDALGIRTVGITS